MQWRVVVELSGEVGVIQVHEVHSGGSTVAGCSAAMLGLTLAEAKAVPGSLQRHLVQAQTEEHCQARRRCPRCGAHRPLKDGAPGGCGRCSAWLRFVLPVSTPADAA